MSGHRTMIATGPGSVRRLCCATTETADYGHIALSAIDDRTALVQGRAVRVDDLWRSTLRSLRCGDIGGQVLYPSWWPSARIDVVAAAAAVLGDDVELRPRSWLLERASSARAAVLVEIAEQLVAITFGAVVAVPRIGAPGAVADEIVRRIDEIGCVAATILIDVPSAVSGAATLAAMIGDRVGEHGGTPVEIDDAGMARLASAAGRRTPAESPHPPASTETETGTDTGTDTGTGTVRQRVRLLGWLSAAVVLLAAAVPAMTTLGRRGVVTEAAAAVLVEGRVAVSVPADWLVQRVVAGPGSARVQVSSPSDLEVALHITQSAIADAALSATAEQLRRAIDAEPAGVFVDFNPAGISAGRPAVLYREVRASHHVRWTVLVDGPLRISIGCQSRPGAERAVGPACEQAVRTAHALG